MCSAGEEFNLDRSTPPGCHTTSTHGDIAGSCAVASEPPKSQLSEACKQTSDGRSVCLFTHTCALLPFAHNPSPLLGLLFHPEKVLLEAQPPSF